MKSAVRPSKYRLQNNSLPSRMKLLKDQRDEALRKAMDKRFTNLITCCNTEQTRNTETVNFAEMVRNELHQQSVNAKTLASAGQINADRAKKEAEEKQEKALNAKEAMKRLLKLEEDHSVSIERSSNDEASKMAIDMVQSGNIDINQLAKASARDRKYVWACLEDKDHLVDHSTRIGSVSDPEMILYDEAIWTKIEAHYLAIQAGADSSGYSSVEVNTITNEYLFTVDLHTMKQRNMETGYEHDICRIAVTDPNHDRSILAALRWEALNDTELAFSHAVKAYRKAEYEYYKSVQLLEEAEDYLMCRLPSDLPDPSIVVGHEQIPMGWSPMGDKLYMEIQLGGAGDLEYDKVARFFAKTSWNKILSITRIQNVMLWFLYEHNRRIVKWSKPNNGDANEDYLWHGCNMEGSLEKILVGGFDSSLSKYHPKGGKCYCY